LLESQPGQKRPTFAQAQAMCQQISLELRPLLDPRVDAVLDRIRATHVNGGALFVSFNVGPNEAFDWFASGDGLSMFGILRQLFDRFEVTSALPELEIQPIKPDDPALVTHRLGDCGPLPPGIAAHGITEDFEVANSGYEGEFQVVSTFLFDGELARVLYAGGCYTRPEGDGRAEKASALAFCEALFGLRWSEVAYYSTHSPWTRWFGNISETLDWTAILFDRRTRTLSILVTTDTD
jgi:hypothetical protein